MLLYYLLKNTKKTQMIGRFVISKAFEVQWNLPLWTPLPGGHLSIKDTQIKYEHFGGIKTYIDPMFTIFYIGHI
jgi:hypothetical protein